MNYEVGTGERQPLHRQESYDTNFFLEGPRPSEIEDRQLYMVREEIYMPRGPLGPDLRKVWSGAGRLNNRQPTLPEAIIYGFGPDNATRLGQQQSETKRQRISSLSSQKFFLHSVRSPRDDSRRAFSIRAN